MKTKPTSPKNLILFAVLCMVPVAANAQFYTNSDGIWEYNVVDNSVNIGEYKNAFAVSAVAVPAVINGLPVTSIGQNAFNPENAGDLTSVTMPDSVTSIGEEAFSGSTITNVLLDNSITNLGMFAFARSDLSSIVIPGSVPSIAEYAFEDCTNLRSATLANGITMVTNYLFSGCTSLNSVQLPNSLTAINQFAFSGCYHLTNVLIPGSVTSIAPYAFQSAIYMNALYFLGNAPPNTNYVFQYDDIVTNYYQSFTTGWSNTFDGMPTATWIPPLPALGITTYSNLPMVFFPVTMIGTNLVVRMNTDLSSTNWVIVTNGVPFIGIQIPNPPSNTYFQLQ